MTGILTFTNNSEDGGDTVVCIHTKNEGRDKFENDE